MDRTLITSDRLDTFSKLKPLVDHVDGIVAEVGVYKGGSLKVLAKLFDDVAVLGFDTFEGLPEEQWVESEIHEIGDFHDTTLEDVQEFLRDCTNVVLTKGIFPDSAKGLEDYKFKLVHIDTDFYLSVKLSLEWFWPRMVSGGIIVLDDYRWGNCPGVEQALEEFSMEQGIWIASFAKYQAHIFKP
jgi:hypothetical protein